MDQPTSTKPNEARANFIANLSATTVDKLRAAKGNPAFLAVAVDEFFSEAKSAALPVSEMEDILGVNESCIMDLAELSEADEEAVMDRFETIAYG